MKIEEIRSKYKTGQRIRLLHMEDPYDPVPDGPGPYELG